MPSNTRTLECIVAWIEEIERQFGSGHEHPKARFDRNELLRTWCAHHLQVIADACGALMADRPAEAWHSHCRNLARIRELLSWENDVIDWREVWSLLRNDLAPLKAEFQSRLADRPASPPELPVDPSSSRVNP